jgi:dihydroorotate dehydrogenase electron transfer subunit
MSRSPRTAGAATGGTAPRSAPWSQVRGRVLDQRDYGAGHRWLEIAVPREFARPAAGQFMQLLLPPTLSPTLLPRPMSVADVRAHRGGLAIGFLYAPVGTGTRALAHLERNDEVDMLGPLGHGFPIEAPGTPVLIAGGRGVAPLLFAAAALAKSGRRCAFIFGARSKDLLVGLSDARRRLAGMRGALHLCTDDGSRGLRGDVIDVLERVAPKLDGPIVIHACGPHGMLKAVARWAVTRDVRVHVAMESVMACGTGVCRGCPLPRSAAAQAAFDPSVTPSLFGNREFAMCCTEGPVFEARELDWERVE